MVRNIWSLPEHCRHKPKDLGSVRPDGRVVCTGPWGSGQAVPADNRLLAGWLTNGRRLPGRLWGESTDSIADLMADFWAHAGEEEVSGVVPTGHMGDRNVRAHG